MWLCEGDPSKLPYESVGAAKGPAVLSPVNRSTHMQFPVQETEAHSPVAADTPEVVALNQPTVSQDLLKVNDRQHSLGVPGWYSLGLPEFLVKKTLQNTLSDTVKSSTQFLETATLSKTTYNDTKFTIGSLIYRCMP